MNKCFFFAAGLTLLVQPAFADTRDDVLSAMQRCRAIADDRSWLDCTYGAEQPMRAKLGLPPAPEFQQRLVPPASSYAVPYAAPYAASADLPPRRPAPLRRSKAGFFDILTGSATPVAVSAIEALDFDGQGAFVITLQNGQVWRQTDAEVGAKVRFRIGTTVTIKPGALSSYNLQAGDNNHIYKVQRRS